MGGAERQETTVGMNPHSLPTMVVLDGGAQWSISWRSEAVIWEDWFQGPSTLQTAGGQEEVPEEPFLVREPMLYLKKIHKEKSHYETRPT